MTVTVGNDLIPVNGLKAYLDETMNDEKLSLNEKKDKFISIKGQVDKQKRTINKEQIEPLNLIKKGADEYRKMVIEAQDAERKTPELFSKRLDELAEYGLMSENGGEAERVANDLSYWTENDKLKEKKWSEISKLVQKENGVVAPDENIPQEDDDHNGNLVDDAKFLGARYGAKVTVNPFKKQIVIDY